MSNVECGPYRMQISDGLDFYKTTMSQLAYEKEPDAQVTFKLNNRGAQRIIDYVQPSNLQARFDLIMQQGFSADEITFLSGIAGDNNPLFSDEYLAQLSKADLPMVNVSQDESGELQVTACGDWPMVTFWETIVMSEINEAYFESYVQKHGLDLAQLYEDGDNRLTNKIERLKARPGIKIADFGTRRHFSYRWQRHVVNRLANELPNQLLGTSNIGLAMDLGLPPIGTFAHEMPMIYSGLADSRNQNIRSSHGNMLDDWFERYGKKLSTALTDTYGSSFFFADFGANRAAAWNGVRHDSGDPVMFGEKVISFYEELGIDPMTKTIVFSDGLDIDAIEKLHDYFSNRINVVFGWGTSLTNDLGIKPLNIVMKAVNVNGAETVKLSDVGTKHTGSEDKVRLYEFEYSTTK